MKITKPTFQPINITITIESPEELEAIQKMSLRNLQIPDAVYDRRELIGWSHVKLFLDNLAKVVENL